MATPNKLTELIENLSKVRSDSLDISFARVQQDKYFETQAEKVKGVSYSHVRRYQTTDFETNNHQFYITYTKYAFYISCVMFILANATIMNVVPPVITISIGMCFAIAYLFVFYMEVKRNYVRRPYEWNKFYWNTNFNESAL